MLRSIVRTKEKGRNADITIRMRKTLQSRRLCGCQHERRGRIFTDFAVLITL